MRRYFRIAIASVTLMIVLLFLSNVFEFKIPQELQYNIVELESTFQTQIEFNSLDLDDDIQSEFHSKLNTIFSNAVFYNNKYFRSCDGGGDRRLSLTNDMGDDLSFQTQCKIKGYNNQIIVASVSINGNHFGYIEFSDYNEIIELIAKYK